MKRFWAYKKDYRDHMEKGEMVAESLSSDPDKSIYFDWTPYLQPDLKRAIQRLSVEQILK